MIQIALLKTNIPKSKIAKIVGVDRSTIYREMNRNGTMGQVHYKATTAQWFAVEMGRRYGDAIRMNAIAPAFS